MEQYRRVEAAENCCFSLKYWDDSLQRLSAVLDRYCPPQFEVQCQRVRHKSSACITANFGLILVGVYTLVLAETQLFYVKPLLSQVSRIEIQHAGFNQKVIPLKGKVLVLHKRTFTDVWEAFFPREFFHSTSSVTRFPCAVWTQSSLL